jgi:hypothetical protein
MDIALTKLKMQGYDSREQHSMIVGFGVAQTASSNFVHVGVS